MVIRKK